MLKSVKREKYKSGQYSCRLPQCDTTLWTVQNWCDWIDVNGTWW